jgi:putative FmdB family regulatory protein
MPTYEYRCKGCQHQFTEVQTITEHEKTKPACPKCQSQDVELVYGSVFVKTSRKA